MRKKKMKNKSIVFIFTAFLLFLTGCNSIQATPQPASITRGSAFSAFYQEAPRSILILPPINNSTDALAKDYYLTTVEIPYAMKGYYVFPVEIVHDVLKQQGIYDSSMLLHTPLEKFYEYFGADAVLFTTINKWDLAYAVVASSLTVSIDAKLISTKTNQLLWKNSATVTIDLGRMSNANSLEALLIQVAITALSSASADYVDYAKQLNWQLVSTLPYGPYHPKYLQDQNQSVSSK